jgi:hypothetical protein
MLKTEQEIKEDQLKALTKRLKEILGFRYRGHSFELKDIMEALTKEKIQVDPFSILIATNSYCTDNITKRKTYSKINPLVWFIFFGMEDQPIFTIDFLYKLFFPETRMLQPDKTTKLNIRYEREYPKNPIVNYRVDCLHSNDRRGRIILGRGQENKPRRIDP